MYTVASPDPNPRGEGQLPIPNDCNSTLTSGTRGETRARRSLLTLPSAILTLTSGTSGGVAPTYIYIYMYIYIYIYELGEEVNYLTLMNAILR